MNLPSNELTANAEIKTTTNTSLNLLASSVHYSSTMPPCSGPTAFPLTLPSIYRSQTRRVANGIVSGNENNGSTTHLVNWRHYVAFDMRKVMWMEIMRYVQETIQQKLGSAAKKRSTSPEFHENHDNLYETKIGRIAIRIETQLLSSAQTMEEYLDRATLPSRVYTAALGLFRSNMSISSPATSPSTAVDSQDALSSTAVPSVSYVTNSNSSVDHATELPNGERTSFIPSVSVATSSASEAPLPYPDLSPFPSSMTTLSLPLNYLFQLLNNGMPLLFTMFSTIEHLYIFPPRLPLSTSASAGAVISYKYEDAAKAFDSILMYLCAGYCPQLVCFTFSGIFGPCQCAPSEQSLRQLVQIFNEEKCPRLCKLNLSGNALDDKSMEILLLLFHSKQGRCLTDLDLSDNILSDLGMSLFVNCIVDQECYQDYLSENLSPAVSNELASSNVSSTTSARCCLKSLNLSGNRLTDIHAFMLSDILAIPCLTTLVEIYLERTAIDLTGALQIVNTVKYLQNQCSLKKIKFDTQILQLLQQQYSLQFMDV